VLSVKEVRTLVAPLVVQVTTARVAGAGFVVRDDGWIATSYHVVEGASDVRVTLPGGRTSTVDLIRMSPTVGDLVLVHAQNTIDFRSLKLGSTEDDRRTKLVRAVGPAKESSAEEGPKNINVIDAVLLGRRPVHGRNLLQFSEPVSTDWSGGPLMNEHGEVVGILSNDRPGDRALDLGVPVESLKALLDANSAPLPVNELTARAGKSCSKYGMNQCSSNCWDGYDGVSCTSLARMAEQKKDLSLAFEAASEACQLGASGGCSSAAAIAIKHHGMNRPALSEMMDLLLEACAKEKKDACGMVPAVAQHAGRPLDAAATAIFLDKGCAGELKSACFDLSRAYATGHGVKRSIQRAMEYRRRGLRCGTGKAREQGA
jgi:hypothetical protein